MKKNIMVLFLLVIFFSLSISQIFNYQDALAEEKFPEWILGDVIDLDLESNQLTISYIDYNNEGKEVIVTVSSKTRYKNVNRLQEINIGDVVAVDCTVTPGGEIVALNIDVEKLGDVSQRR